MYLPKNWTGDRVRLAATHVPEPVAFRWSIQEVRRIASTLAQRRIRPTHIIAWPCHRLVMSATHPPSHRQTHSPQN
jgi:hypothetical protein